MKRRTRLNKWLSLLLATALAVVCCLPFELYSSSAATSQAASSGYDLDPDDAESITDLTAQYQELQKQLDALEKEKEQIEDDANATEKTIKNLKKQISAAEKQMDLLEEEIDRLSGELDGLNSDITTLESEIAVNLETFRKRLRAIYMSGTANELELLLSAENYLDLLTRAEILRRISEHDNKLIDSLTADKTALEDTVKLTSEVKAQTEEKNAEMKAKRKELNSMYSENEDLLDKLEKAEEETEEAIKQYQDEMAAAQREIDEILSKYVSDDDYIGGSLCWPLPGFTKITSPYGQRSSGFHTGTDIAGRNSAGDLCYGYDVLAANTGTVIAVRNLGTKSYGRYLIIDHGGGCRTLYAHLSKVLVSEGDVVIKGDVIARAGSTGNSTGPHLHFELWIDGTRVNPMNNKNELYLVIPKS